MTAPIDEERRQAPAAAGFEAGGDPEHVAAALAGEAFAGAGVAVASAVALEPPYRASTVERVRHLRARGLLQIGTGTLVVVGLIVASFLPISGYGPNTMGNDINGAPSAQHLFGTDTLGRDLLARTLAAAHTDVPIALLGALLAMVAGGLVGLLASVPGRVGEGVMRFIDTFQAFPPLLLVLIIAGLTGGGIPVLVVVLALLNVPQLARLTRNQALHLRTANFVTFPQILGAKPARILRTHVLPNAAGIIIVQTTIAAAIGLATIGALSFLGFGVKPPTPSWGAMIQQGANGISSGQWWGVVFPGAALVIAIAALNTLGDGLHRLLVR